MKAKLYILSLFLFLCMGMQCAGQAAKKATVGRVNDYAGILSKEQETKLAAVQQSLEDSTGSQIAVLIIDSLNNTTIEEYALNTFRKWGIGRKEYNDGILVLVAVFNRQMRIEVGYGLEKIIRDEIAARIIQEEMVPFFRQEKYYEGLLAAIIKMKQLILDNRQLIGDKS